MMRENMASTAEDAPPVFSQQWDQCWFGTSYVLRDWVTQCKTKDRTSQPDVLATRTFREATSCLTGNTWWPSPLEDQKCHSTEEPWKPGEQNASQAAAAQGKGAPPAVSCGCHQRTNTGVKSYRCRECGRAFVYQSFLRRHMDIHTGEQPYECEQCGKAFRYSLHLNKHLTKHIVSKNYACQECGKAFPKSSKLTAHIRTHTAERPYACEECGKTFTKSSGLQRHLKTHR
ncbi:zinc finger protein 114 [Callospermophilus lateralis]